MRFRALNFDYHAEATYRSASGNDDSSCKRYCVLVQARGYEEQRKAPPPTLIRTGPSQDSTTQSVKPNHDVAKHEPERRDSKDHGCARSCDTAFGSNAVGTDGPWRLATGDEYRCISSLATSTSFPMQLAPSANGQLLGCLARQATTLHLTETPWTESLRVTLYSALVRSDRIQSDESHQGASPHHEMVPVGSVSTPRKPTMAATGGFGVHRVNRLPGIGQLQADYEALCQASLPRAVPLALGAQIASWDIPLVQYPTTTSVELMPDADDFVRKSDDNNDDVAERDETGIGGEAVTCENMLNQSQFVGPRSSLRVTPRSSLDPNKRSSKVSFSQFDQVNSTRHRTRTLHGGNLTLLSSSPSNPTNQEGNDVSKKRKSRETREERAARKERKAAKKAKREMAKKRKQSKIQVEANDAPNKALKPSDDLGKDAHIQVESRSSRPRSSSSFKFSAASVNRELDMARAALQGARHNRVAPVETKYQSTTASSRLQVNQPPQRLQVRQSIVSTNRLTLRGERTLYQAQNNGGLLHPSMGLSHQAPTRNPILSTRVILVAESHQEMPNAISTQAQPPSAFYEPTHGLSQNQLNQQPTQLPHVNQPPTQLPRDNQPPTQLPHVNQPPTQLPYVDQDKPYEDFNPVPHLARDSKAESETCGRPVQLLCSEAFLETWGECVAELASGRWAKVQDSESDELESTPPIQPSDARKICLVDSPLVKACNVDIEASGRCGLLVLAASSLESAETAKQTVRNVAELAAMDRYAQLYIIICCDVDISLAASKHIIQLQSAVVVTDGLPQTQVAFKTVTKRSLSTCLAQTILSRPQVLPNIQLLEDATVDAVTDSQVTERAQFLLSLLPSLSVNGAIQCQLLAENILPIGSPSFELLFKNERLRQQIALTTTSQDKGSDVHATAMSQLALVVNANIAAEIQAAEDTMG